MLIYTKKNGFCYESESTGKRYDLHEMTAYKGEATSDIIAIWDSENDCLVNHLYGASLINISGLDSLVSDYVREYEAKREEEERKPAPLSYRFTRDGVKLFLEDSVNDIFAELDKQENGDPAKYDFIVSCGHRSIRVFCGAEEYDLLCRFLEDALEVNGEE